MKTQNQHRRSSSPALFESLESRQFLSASPVVKAAPVAKDATISTTTALFISDRSALLGQTVTIKGVVAASNGAIDARATVELLDNDKDTGLTGIVNHLGYCVFSLDPGQAVFVGTHLWRIRVLSFGDIIGSKSRQLIAKTVGPSLTTESNGLELTTVTNGTGAAAAAGETVTVQYTGFDDATGDEFDDSAAHSPGTFSFVLDDSPEQVIAGFDQEVTGMKVGETRVAIIPSALGYNDGETRVFVVHLVSIS